MVYNSCFHIYKFRSKNRDAIAFRKGEHYVLVAMHMLRNDVQFIDHLGKVIGIIIRLIHFHWNFCQPLGFFRPCFAVVQFCSLSNYLLTIRDFLFFLNPRPLSRPILFSVFSYLPLTYISFVLISKVSSVRCMHRYHFIRCNFIILIYLLI